MRKGLLCKYSESMERYSAPANFYSRNIWKLSMWSFFDWRVLTGRSPRGSRFAGSFVLLCEIQIVVSFGSSNEELTIRAESGFGVYLSNVSADSFAGVTPYSCRRDFATKVTCQLYIYEFTIWWNWILFFFCSCKYINYVAYWQPNEQNLRLLLISDIIMLLD